MFSNECTKVGDYVLMLNAVHAEWRGDAWSKNDRGIGSNNRTHDVCAEDCEVYRINRIRTLCSYQDKFQLRIPGQGILRMYEDEFNKMSMVRKSKYIFRGVDDVEYYVSVPKRWCASGKAKANLRVYRNEFLNLTFLNSVDLSQLLESYSKDVIVLGDDEMKFKYARKYIEAAILFTKERESQTADWISDVAQEVLEDIEWPCKLSSWMLSKNIRKLSPFRIKQFVKSLAM